MIRNFSVIVSGREIKVIFVGQEELNRRSGDTGVHGFCDEINNTVYVDKDLKGDSQKRVALHEIGHMTFAIGGVSQFLKSKQEEAICDALENWLELFKDRSLMNYLEDTSNEDVPF